MSQAKQQEQEQKPVVNQKRIKPPAPPNIRHVLKVLFGGESSKNREYLKSYWDGLMKFAATQYSNENLAFLRDYYKLKKWYEDRKHTKEFKHYMVDMVEKGKSQRVKRVAETFFVPYIKQMDVLYKYLSGKQEINIGSGTRNKLNAYAAAKWHAVQNPKTGEYEADAKKGIFVAPEIIWDGAFEDVVDIVPGIVTNWRSASDEFGGYKKWYNDYMHKKALENQPKQNEEENNNKKAYNEYWNEMVDMEDQQSLSGLNPDAYAMDYSPHHYNYYSPHHDHPYNQQYLDYAYKHEYNQNTLINVEIIALIAIISIILSCIALLCGAIIWFYLFVQNFYCIPPKKETRGPAAYVDNV